MKVERPQGPRGAGAPHKAARAGSGGGFADMVAGLAPAAPAQAPHAVADVGALLAVQAAGEEESGARAGAERGRKVLSALAALQVGLLSGAPDPAALAEAAGAHRPPGARPDLSAALDAIDLRAAVEMARAKRQSPWPLDRPPIPPDLASGSISRRDWANRAEAPPPSDSNRS